MAAKTKKTSKSRSLKKGKKLPSTKTLTVKGFSWG
jgi:hypothetical protein